MCEDRVADATGFVQASMLTRPVTLTEYESMYGELDLAGLSPEVVTRIEQRRTEVQSLLQGGASFGSGRTVMTSRLLVDPPRSKVMPLFGHGRIVPQRLVECGSFSSVRN